MVIKKDIFLKSNLIEIKKFNKRNISKEYLSWLNDSEVTKYSQQRFVKYNKNKLIDYYYEQLRKKNLFLAIHFLKEPNKKIHIGNLGVNFNELDNTADLSILLGNKKYWNKKLATHAWVLTLEYLFKIRNVRMVTAGTLSVNIPMLKLINKTKMNIDGILKKRKIWNNKEVDVVLSSITKKNFVLKIKNAKYFIKTL